MDATAIGPGESTIMTVTVYDPEGDGLDQNCDGVDGQADADPPSADEQTIAR